VKEGKLKKEYNIQQHITIKQDDEIVDGLFGAHHIVLYCGTGARASSVAVSESNAGRGGYSYGRE
jgi:hypothetical protein